MIHFGLAQPRETQTDADRVMRIYGYLHRMARIKTNGAGRPKPNTESVKYLTA